LRNNAAPSAVVPLLLKRSSLGSEAVQTATCPACGLRPARQVERFTLRANSPAVDLAEKLLSPPAVVAAALLSGFFIDTVWWPFIMVFGPSSAISIAAGIRLSWSARYRLKVALCPSCSATIRASRRRTRMARLVKNSAAWGLVMLAPMVFTPIFGDNLFLLGPVSGALALACSVAHWVERAWRGRADALLPLPDRVSDDGVRLLPPPAWMPVLREEAPGLLLLPAPEG
jgi:hypothetical protein